MVKDITRKPKKIDNKIFLIAYEGNSDEKEYFEALENSIPNRFKYIVKFIAIPKSSTDSSPNHIRDDLIEFARQKKLKTTSKDIEAVIVFDKDNNFNGTHKRGTFEVIADCKRRGINIIISAPCFEIWKILHFKDIANENEEYRNKLIENKKPSKNGDRYIKQLTRKVGVPSNSKELFGRTEVAIENEQALNDLYDHIDIESPRLMSNIGIIFKTALELNLPIFEFINATD